MHIMFIVAVYPPEGEPTAIMAKQIVEHLASQGHLITVVCPFPNRPHGKVFQGYKRSWKLVTNEDGAKIIRVWTWLIGQKRKFLNRLLENTSFGITSSLKIFRNRPNLILLETWPIFAQLPVLLIAKLFHIPVVNYIKDIYPEVAIAGGIISPTSSISKIFKGIDRFICKKSWQNIVISKTMYDYFIEFRKIEPTRLRIIWDWLDLSLIHPVHLDGTWRREVGLNESDFVCMFSGTMGYASGADVLIEIASLLKEHTNIKIVCIGEGVLKEKIISAKNNLHLDNLLVLPFQPRERLCEVQSSSDVLLLTASPTMGTSSVPSKFITYIAIGKPVVCGTGPHSDLSQLVNCEKLGISVLPGSAESMTNAILEIMRMDQQDRVAMGQRARSVALKMYSLEAAMQQFDILVDKVEAH